MAAATQTTPTAPPNPTQTQCSSGPSGPGSGQSPPPDQRLFTQGELVEYARLALQVALQNTRQQARQESTSGSSTLTSQRGQNEAQQDRYMRPRMHICKQRSSSSSTNTMIVTLELPGLQRGDLALQYRACGELVVTGERRASHLQSLHDALGFGGGEDELERTVYNELKFGKFQRVIRLPQGVDVSSYFTDF